MSSYGVVSKITAPVLKSSKQQSLIEFETEYQAYKSKIADVNRTCSTSTRMAVATIKQCLDPTFLHSLCMMGRIEGATTAEEATDQGVQKWFDELLAKNPKDISERIRSAINSVKFSASNKDPQGAVSDYILSIVAALDQHNAYSILKEPKACENLINQLIPKLSPPELRMRIKNERAYWSSSERSSISHFDDRASALAVDTHNGEIARAMCEKGKGRDRGSSSDQVKPRYQNNRKKWTGTKREKGRKRTAEESEATDEWVHLCLNKKCKKKHRIRDCEITPEDEKRRLLAEFRANNRKNFKRVELKSDLKPSKTAEHAEGRYRVILNDTVETIALGDYGADVNAISKADFEKLAKEDSGL